MLNDFEFSPLSSFQIMTEWQNAICYNKFLICPFRSSNVEDLMTKRFRVQTTVTVRFSDTDAMGHCNNSRYFSFMEEGRVAYFKHLFPNLTSKDSFEMFPFILGDIQCRFQAPAYCADELSVSLGVTEFGNKSFVMEYDIHRKNDQLLLATGRSTLVMFDYKIQQSYPIPDAFKQVIQERG